MTSAADAPAAPVAESDEALLARFAKGDAAALEALARRLERPMLGLALGLVNGRRELAMDAVQETWVRVIQRAASFRGDASASTWIYRILINRCHTVRERADRDTSKRSARNIPLEKATSAPQHSTAPEPDDVAALRSAVERLAEPKREVLLLCYHAGLSHPQAADILAIPLGTLKSRLNAALTELRTLLQSAPS